MIQLLLKFLTSGVSAMAAAPAQVEGEEAGQSELFPPEPTALKPAIPVGAIVMPLIYQGHIGTPYIYFQVRQAKSVRQMIAEDVAQQHPKWDEKKRAPVLAHRLSDYAKLMALPGSQYPALDSYRYQIDGIPYGFRVTHLWSWLEEDYLFDTGLRWRVPDHRELDLWSEKSHPWPKDAAGGKGGYTRSFLSTYHTPMNGQADHPDVPPEKKEQYHYDNRPYKEEKELVRMLDSLDPKVYPRWNAVMSLQQYDRLIDERILTLKKRQIERSRA